MTSKRSIMLENTEYTFDIDEVSRAIEKALLSNQGTATITLPDNSNVLLNLSIEQVSNHVVQENIKTVVGNQIPIILLGFNSDREIVGKVDTGASFCSLHATNIEIKPTQYAEKGDLVLFDYNDTRYRMPLVNKQAVSSSDGGTQYRPVVKFNVVMNQKTYTDILFNLNDRAEMEHDILLGENFLEASRVLVDPTLHSD